MGEIPFEFMSPCEYCARPTLNARYCSKFCQEAVDEKERERYFIHGLVGCMGLLGVGIIVAAIVLGCLR
jgi:predicted nucleic acid-binding Zn ribbon protein